MTHSRVGVSSKEAAKTALTAWLSGQRPTSALRRSQQPLVLFLSRTNTATSIMAEALLEQLGSGGLRAASAGDAPDRAGLNTHALECLRAHGIATRGLRSKSWSEFFGLTPTPVRVLITLCEVDAVRVNWERSCGRLVRAEWPMADPTDVIGQDTDIQRAFERAYNVLRHRIRRLVALPLSRIPDRALARELAHIGQEP